MADINIKVLKDDINGPKIVGNIKGSKIWRVLKDQDYLLDKSINIKNSKMSWKRVIIKGQKYLEI